MAVGVDRDGGAGFAPLAAEPFRVPIAVFERLRDEGRLVPGSPAGFLIGRKDSFSTPDERAQSAADVARGPAALRSAIEIAARPEGCLRVHFSALNRPDAAISFAIADGRGVLTMLGRDDHVYLAPPLALDDLIASIVHDVGTGPLPWGEDEAYLWPSELALAGKLWPDASRPLEATVPKASAGMEGDALITAQLADEAADGAIGLLPPVRGWLDLLWGGDRLEVEAAPRRDHLVFVGPRGRRVLYEELTGDAAADAIGDEVPEVEGYLVALTRLPAELIADALRDLAGASAPAGASSSASGGSSSASPAARTSPASTR